MNAIINLHIVILVTLVSVFAGTAAAAETESSGGQNLQTVYYVSLRNKTGDSEPEAFYGDERDRLHTGRCLLARTPSNLPKSLGGNGLVYIPEQRIELELVEVSNPTVFWRQFSEAAGSQRPMLYVHGYNTGFAKGCEQASLLQDRLGLDNRLILFSWPSDGALLNYARDEADLYWSVAPMEDTLLRLVRQSGAGSVDLMAHSLGARGLFMALLRISRAEYQSLPLFNQLVLVAPDIDVGIFEQYLAEIRPLVRNLTLYVSANDKPLSVSREIHGYPRLGEAGSDLDSLKQIEIVDISQIEIETFSGHLYHLYQDAVAYDLDLLLNHGVTAANRIGLEQIAENRWRLHRPAEESN